MSHKLNEKPSTSSSIVACCQSTSTTPDNSIVDYIEEDVEASNNNIFYHAPDGTSNNLSNQIGMDIISKHKAALDSIDFTFPKRPKVDIEFKDVKYSVRQFVMKNRRFGKFIWEKTNIFLKNIPYTKIEYKKSKKRKKYLAKNKNKPKKEPKYL